MATIETIKQGLQDKSTEELYAILNRKNHSEWTDDAVAAIKEVLRERGESVDESKWEHKHQFDVDFEKGFSFASEGFGFVGKGKLAIENQNVILSGKKKWPLIARVGIFLGVTVVPLLLFKFGLGWLLALVIVYYACASAFTTSFLFSDISDLQQQGKKLKFCVNTKDNIAIKTGFKASTEDEAVMIKDLLSARVS
jgi:hypothetical protein